MQEEKAGIRDLKAHLSAYLRKVKAGGIVVITDRGEPIGRIVPVSRDLEEQMEALVSSGLVSWNGDKIGPMAPVARVKGDRTVADLVLEDRG
jgi:prevent-host-death family protein